MIEQSKSPKSCAYARLGKQLSGKHSVPEENSKITRNSTGNIYEEILKQFNHDQSKYIRELVNKNQKQQPEPTTNTAPSHHRKKSYADLVVDPPQAKKIQEPIREERETLCKGKVQKDNVLLHQMTPKNSTMTRSDFIKPTNQFQSVNFSGFVKRQSLEKNEGHFLDNLTNYLDTLSNPSDHIKPQSANERFGDTLKIGTTVSNDSHHLAAKLEQSMTKIKEYKLKNHFLEKQLNKFSKRERKMKECLHEMLEEIKQMSAEVTREKKERKRLEKVIETLEMQQFKGERKTIGKPNITKIEEFQQKICQFSQIQDPSDLDSSFRENYKYSSNGRQTKGPSPFRHDRQISNLYRGILDSTKIDEMFKSSYHSDEDESYE